MSPAAVRRRKIRVFLIDAHPLVRDGVRSYLTHHGIAVVGEAAGAAQALRRVKALAPDVVVLDADRPTGGGGGSVRRLRVAVPTAKLVAFSIHSSQEYVVKMARCGVQGYVTKDQPAADLLAAIVRVSEGGLSFPPGMSDALLAPGLGLPAARASGEALTGRESVVLGLLAEGLSNAGVAAKLGVSLRTAENHREHLARKLGLRAVSGLTRYALAHGLTVL